MTLYHVAGPHYTGGDLHCAQTLLDRGIITDGDNKWADDNGGNWPDADVVCLYDTLDEATDHAEEYGGTILRIDISDDETEQYEDGITLRRVDEGFLAVVGCIPSFCITAV